MDIAELQGWVGRSETREDVAAVGPIEGLAALLDHETPPWRKGEIPPLAHWLYFLAHPRQSEIDIDGHPRRGNFLPPITLPRRMWAGSRISFEAPIPIGAAISRRSSIAAVNEKSGSSGRMIFVTVKHEISADGALAIREEQDIVFREAPRAATPGPSASREEHREGENVRKFTPDPTQLFRFSALTFNAHRIHYDRDYCRDVEGYPGLVVQGPFTAMLLMDHFLRANPAANLKAFEFRAQRPLFDTAPFDLCLSNGGELRARSSTGETAMVARVTPA